MESMGESWSAGASEASRGKWVAGPGWGWISQFLFASFGSERIRDGEAAQVALRRRVCVVAGAGCGSDRQVALGVWASDPWSRCARIVSKELKASGDSADGVDKGAFARVGERSERRGDVARSEVAGVVGETIRGRWQGVPRQLPEVCTAERSQIRGARGGRLENRWSVQT